MTASNTLDTLTIDQGDLWSLIHTRREVLGLQPKADAYKLTKAQRELVTYVKGSNFTKVMDLTTGTCYPTRTWKRDVWPAARNRSCAGKTRRYLWVENYETFGSSMKLVVDQYDDGSVEINAVWLNPLAYSLQKNTLMRFEASEVTEDLDLNIVLLSAYFKAFMNNGMRFHSFVQTTLHK